MILSHVPPTLDTMQITATIRQRPEEHAKNVDGLKMDVLTVTGDTYDQAYQDLEFAIPSGWQMLSVRSH